MNTILLPTDFSDTSRNAALYAIKLAKQVGIQNIVLYHSYEILVSVDPVAPAIQMLDLDSLKKSAAAGLEKFTLSIKAFAENIQISSINEYGNLSEGLDEICEKAGADLIVMGITGGGALEEKLIGSTAVTVAKKSKIPVLIVPVQAQYAAIRSIMLSSDFDRSDETVPMQLLAKILKDTQARLLVFHVEEGDEKKGVTHSSNVMTESLDTFSVLKELNPEYHFSDKKFTEAVNEFVEEFHVDLIISIPKQHGFFEGLFHTSHTKMLAFHSQVPILMIHE